MAKQKLKHRTTPLELTLFSLVLVGLILAIVGLFVDFITTKLKLGGAGTSSPLFSDMSNLLDSFKGAVGGLSKDTIHGFEALQAFGIITIIGIAATFVMSMLKVLTDWKFMRILLVIIGVLTLASAIITLILIYTYVPLSIGDAKLFASVPAVGGWLLTIGGMLGGLSGLFCSFTK